MERDVPDAPGKIRPSRVLTGDSGMREVRMVAEGLIGGVDTAVLDKASEFVEAREEARGGEGEGDKSKQGRGGDGDGDGGGGECDSPISGPAAIREEVAGEDLWR
jgi:hypothetical protein